MIPPALAASAASAALGMLSSIASAASSSSSSDASKPTTPSTSTGSTKRNDSIGQPEFLSLLVAQLQNQDPLNPLDSADFSAQLAQFSSLEQLTQINQRLTELGGDKDNGQSFDPVGLLGREVTAAGSSVAVTSGDASQLEYTLESAGKVSLEVHDAAGNLISTANLGDVGAGSHVLDLDDVSSFANLPDGTYAVDLKVQSGDGQPGAVETRIRGTVSSVDLQSNPPVLRIGDIEIPLGDVREVRAPAATA